jgi:hypothetical protein
MWTTMTISMCHIMVARALSRSVSAMAAARAGGWASQRRTWDPGKSKIKAEERVSLPQGGKGK